MMITAHVKPNSRKAEVVKENDTIYKVKVNAFLGDGVANKRLCEILAEYFKVPKSSVIIKKGLKSKIKIIQINEGN